MPSSVLISTENHAFIIIFSDFHCSCAQTYRTQILYINVNCFSHIVIVLSFAPFSSSIVHTHTAQNTRAYIAVAVCYCYIKFKSIAFFENQSKALHGKCTYVNYIETLFGLIARHMYDLLFCQPLKHTQQNSNSFFGRVVCEHRPLAMNTLIGNQWLHTI